MYRQLVLTRFDLARLEDPSAYLETLNYTNERQEGTLVTGVIGARISGFGGQGVTLRLICHAFSSWCGAHQQHLTRCIR